MHHIFIKNIKLGVMCSPLIGSNGRMWRYPGDRLPAPVSLRLTPPSGFSSISRYRAGPFGPVVPLRVILAPTAPDSALRLADALAAAEPVDHILGDGLVKALPVLLGNKDSGKHGGM